MSRRRRLPAKTVRAKLKKKKSSPRQEGREGPILVGLIRSKSIPLPLRNRRAYIRAEKSRGKNVRIRINPEANREIQRMNQSISTTSSRVKTVLQILLAMMLQTRCSQIKNSMTPMM